MKIDLAMSIVRIFCVVIRHIKNLLNFQNGMRAVMLNSEFSGLKYSMSI